MNDQITDAYTIRLADRRFDTTRNSGRFAAVLSYARLSFRQWRVERRAIRHLESLDDHLLKDIGIERAEIRVAVRGLLEQRELDSRSASDVCQRLAA